MRIISWNCNGKFREKFELLRSYCADVCIVAECEDPAQSDEAAYRMFTANGFWNRQTKAKGLGVFARPGVELVRLRSSTEDASFLPVRVNGTLTVVGVWTVKPYAKRFYDYVCKNRDLWETNAVLMGDFNSNSHMAWDKVASRLHKCGAAELELAGLSAMYPRYYGEKSGEETKPTFYLYRQKDKGFHIDHCFAKMENTQKFELLDSESWLQYSDHIPLLLDIKE